jgi:hypothetical protein
MERIGVPVMSMGPTLTGLVIAYSPADASSSGDSANIPLTAHAVDVPDGSDVTADVRRPGSSGPAE